MTKAKKQTPATPATSESTESAIEQGRLLIDQGKSKTEAAMAIFRLIGDQDQQLVLNAFITGASLTPKGALTYWYNCERKIAKEQKNGN